MGSCIWDASYRLVFVDGTSMSETKVFPWSGGTAGYGQSVDVSVDLITPEAAGNYQGNFMILAPDGTSFGLGVENKSFWVRIVVDRAEPTPGCTRGRQPYAGQHPLLRLSQRLDWTVPYDDTGVVEYEVMLEKYRAGLLLVVFGLQHQLRLRIHG